MGEMEPLQDPANGKLDFAIRNFASNLNALRDFVTVLHAALMEHHTKKMTADGLAFAALVLAARTGSASDPEDPSIAELKALCFDAGIKFESVDEEGRCALTVPAELAGKIQETLKNVENASHHRSLLYRSALISLISAGEWFVSQLVRTYIDRFPDSSGMQNRSLTLDDLRGLGSIADAKQFLIEQRVDEIMRGSFDDWLKFFVQVAKLSTSYTEPFKDELVEVFQRRNVMVHNDGVVHTNYVNKVSAKFKGDVEVGSTLTVDPEYLARAIDVIEVVLILIGVELWKKVDKEDTTRGSLLTDIAFERLKAERYVVSEGLSLFEKHDKNLPERDQIIGALNYWQSLKWLDRFGEVKAEVSKTDYSAKDELYQLARYALLDDKAKFFNLLPAVVKSEKLSQESLESWPIFRSMISDDQYREFANANFKPPKELVETIESQNGLVAHLSE